MSKFGICPFQPRPPASSIIGIGAADPVIANQPASNDCVDTCRAFLRISEGGRPTGHACAFVLAGTALANLELQVRTLVAMISRQQETGGLAQPPAPTPS